MDRPSCANCPYFHQKSRGFVSECRFGPPTLSVFSVRHTDRSGYAIEPESRASHSSGWPETSAGEFCGQHPHFPVWIEHQKTIAQLSRKLESYSKGTKGVEDKQ